VFHIGVDARRRTSTSVYARRWT